MLGDFILSAGADMQQSLSAVSVSVPINSKKYKFADNDKIYFISFAVTNCLPV
jgi:hypothetical protein